MSESTALALRIVKSFVASSLRVRSSGISVETITQSSRMTTTGTISLPIVVRLSATVTQEATPLPGKMGAGKVTKPYGQPLPKPIAER
jgi:hypothetical protein